MGKTKFEPVEFKELVSDVCEDRIILPDFQRGFVWRDKNKQKALIASVLTKLPIGTILLLEVNPNQYGCKKIGLKNRKPVFEKNSGNVQALLDGQQRVTVLTAFFSNMLFELAKGEGEFVSPSLKRRYFLKLPTFHYAEGKRDLFGWNTLLAPAEIREKVYPKYSTEEILDWITFLDSDRKKNILGTDVENVSEEELAEFCTAVDEGKDYYILPLYYLYGAATKKSMSHRNRFEAVLKRIASKYKADILREIKGTVNLSEVEKIINRCAIEEDVAEKLTKDFSSGKHTVRDEASELYKICLERFEKRATDWARDMGEFLFSCIEEMELYKIEVPQANILRAIDIYENLNLGGKSLDIFDLILARAATNGGDDNLLSVVKKYIFEDHKKEYEVFVENCAQCQTNAYRSYMEDREEYSASKFLGGWDEAESELASTYCEALMGVMGTLHFFMDSNKEIHLVDMEKIKNITSGVTKGEYLLKKIEPCDIEGLVKRAAKGIDRACLFLQLKCGIRKISEIQYKLVLVLLAVIFSEDRFFYSKKVCNYLEAWYWAAIFSGEFKREQNSAFQDNMRKILEILNGLGEQIESSTYRPDYIINLCNHTFCDDKFANEEILLGENQFIEPENVLGKTLCQFMLARTYMDLLKKGADKKYKQKKIDVFYEAENKEILQRHHIMPIGEISTHYKDIEKELNTVPSGESDVQKKERMDTLNKYNSPLNFVYISGTANRIISNTRLRDYINLCDTGTLSVLNISKVDKADRDELETFLHNRYQSICADLLGLYRTNLQCDDVVEFYELSKMKKN